MLVLITLNCACLCVPTTMSHDLMEPNISGLNSNQIWPPQFKLKPMHMINLSVESNDLINNWSGCFFKGFHNLKVGRFDWFATYMWDKDQFTCVQNDHKRILFSISRVYDVLVCYCAVVLALWYFQWIKLNSFQGHHFSVVEAEIPFCKMLIILLVYAFCFHFW